MAKIWSTSEKRTFNSEQAGARIIKIAAFCFAIISWLATAEGLQLYVFDYDWQAYLISFGVQGILFVLNLKLPFYFRQLGQSKSSIKKNGNPILQSVIAVFYALSLLFSSFFSFVYISDTVVYGHDSGYIDDNTVLNNSYHSICNQTEVFIDENLKATQIIASKQLAELQVELKKHQTGENSANLESLQKTASDMLLQYENALTEVDYLKSTCNSKYEHMEAMREGRFLDPDAYEKAKKEYEQSLKDLQEATEALAVAKLENEAAQQALESWEKTDIAITSGFLIELLSDSPNPDSIATNIELLMSNITQLDGANIPPNFSSIIQKAQALRVTLQQYLDLKKLNNEKDSSVFSISQIDDGANIPSVESPTFMEQKNTWQDYWQTKYWNLKKAIQQLPAYNSTYTEYLEDNMIDVAVLENYNKDLIIAEIDNLLRFSTTDINVIERSANMFRGKYPFAAIFSTIIAIFLDISSLLAGLFLYGLSNSKQDAAKAPNKTLAMS